MLIAHPERCTGWWTDQALLDEACAAGARLQVNASSLTGAHGPEVRRRALTLVRARRAAVLASDAHSDARPPCMGEALAVLAHEGIAGEPLVRERPAALLVTGLPRLQPLPLLA